MRKLLGTFTLAIIVLGALGLYRGWFNVSTDSEDNRTKIEVTIDKEQVKKDADLVKGGVQDLTEKMKSNSGETAGDDAGETGAERPILPPEN